MLKAAAFGEWLPDIATSGLSVANNARAVANGYAPVGAPQAVTDALPAAFNGGGAFIDSNGGSTLLGATNANVYRYSGGWASVGAMASGQVVRMAQFGDNALFAPGGVVKSYNLTSTAFTTPTDAPIAVDIAQVRDFVMAITDDNAAQWCQFNNSSVWTTGANQADKQPSLWGQMRRIVGGEYAIILTDKAIVRVSYVGSANDIIFQFDEIAAEVGCMVGGSVCNVGRLIFFLSERGFMMCDGAEVTPIADEKFNRWFFKKFARADIDRIWSAIDPRYSLALWAMPGDPGVVVAYNWVLKRATTFQIPVTGLFTGYTAGVDVDHLDALYGNLDAMPISLDDPSLAGGNPLLLVADADNKLTALTGDNLEATFRLENIEPTAGRRSRIRSVRLITDAVEGSATIDARMRAGDGEAVRASATMRSNGRMPIRSNGRYNTLEVAIPAGATWTNIQGAELEFEPGGER